MEAGSPGLNYRAGTRIAGGFAFWSDLAAFLTEYDGLMLDACWAAVADAEWMTRYNERTRARLSPVGAAYSEHLLVWLAEDGRFFGTYDDLVGELGRTPDQLLDALLNERVELRDTDVL